MQVSEDVMELVQLLNEEGFGDLAGELLIEISLGREIDDPGDDDAEAEGASDSEDSFTEPEDMVLREPIAEDEQLGMALLFLESQLVGPVRHLAEAEAIAGHLAVSSRDGVPRQDPGDTIALGPDSASEPMRIVFRPPPGRSGEVLRRTEAPGATRWADALSTALRRLEANPGRT